MESVNSHGDISIDDLQERQQRLARVIGMDNLIKLSESFGGKQIYIPKADEIFRGRAYRQIVAEFDDCPDVKLLADKYDISESTVRRLVGDKLKKVKKKPIEGQLAIE